VRVNALGLYTTPVGKLAKGCVSNEMFFVVTEARKLGNPEVGGTYKDNLVIPFS
jgi:hypothetical protein